MLDNFEMFTDKSIAAEEFAVLMDSIGWGSKHHYDLDEIRNSIESYTFVAHIRSHSGELVAYISSFSDGAFSTFIGELAVHPSCQSKGLGKELVNAVENQFKGVPIYAKPFESEKEFYIQQGYTEPKRPMVVVSKRNQT